MNRKPAGRSRSIATAKSSGNKHRSPRGKKSCVLAACVLVAVLFSVRRTLSFRSALEQWSSLSLSTFVVAESSGASGSTNGDTRAAYFLEAEASALSDQDMGTGMWWQSIASFSHFPVTKLRLRNQTLTQSASNSNSVLLHHRDRVLMTRNWLDFAVESVGLYHEHFFGSGTDTGTAATSSADADEMVFHPILQQQMQTYISSRKDRPSLVAKSSSSSLSLAPQRTIAMIPFTSHVTTSAGGLSGLSRSQRRHYLELKVEALAATLASLQQVGIARAVVVGLSDADREWALSAFEEVQVQTSMSSTSATPMQLAFVVAPGCSPEVIRNNEQESSSLQHLLEKQALHGLDVAMRGSPSLLGAPVSAWLGEKPTQITATQTPGHVWQYVYWTQPNLLLHTRASSMPILQEALDQGAILTAHRMPVIPHVSDFGDVVKNMKSKKGASLNMLVPATAVATSAIMSLDGDIAACCDAGNGRPALGISQPDCARDTPWWQCGFGISASADTTSTSATDRHVRKVPYAWMRLQNSGTGFALMAASESARMCTRVASGSCAADGSIVSAPSMLLSSLSSWAWGGSSEQQEESHDPSNEQDDSSTRKDTTEVVESDGIRTESDHQSIHVSKDKDNVTTEVEPNGIRTDSDNQSFPDSKDKDETNVTIEVESDGIRTDSDNQSVQDSKDKTDSMKDDSTELVTPNRTVGFMKRPQFGDGDP
jgi:hypothetical protein